MARGALGARSSEGWRAGWEEPVAEEEPADGKEEVEAKAKAGVQQLRHRCPLGLPVEI